MILVQSWEEGIEHLVSVPLGIFAIQIGTATLLILNLRDTEDPINL